MFELVFVLGKLCTRNYKKEKAKPSKILVILQLQFISAHCLWMKVSLPTAEDRYPVSGVFSSGRTF